MENQKKTETEASSVFKVGAIALAFLIVGYQAALFVNRAAESRIVANRDVPDTVFVVDEPLAAKLLCLDASAKSSIVVRKTADHPAEARKVYGGVPKERRRVESFKFNPNTASLDDFVRLGFSEKQARSILNYREKGGRFRRKSDFAKSYVVADSVY